MALSPGQEAVIEEIVAELPAGADWYIFGSVDSVLRGVDADPSDVDVLATEATAELFREHFAAAFVETREVGQSQVDRYRLHDEDLEVTYSRSNAAQQEPLVEFGAIDGTASERGVPMLPLDRALAAYEKIGKDDAIAALRDRAEG